MPDPRRSVATPHELEHAAEAGLPFNRTLRLSDYDHPQIRDRVHALRMFRETSMRGLFFRNDHLHRDWEYAEVLRKLDALWILRLVHDDGRSTTDVRVLDTGFGCSYFTQYLKLVGYDVHASDSEAYGPVREKLIEQCVALGTQIPLIIAPVEDHGMIPDGHFDVSMCISVIEHIERQQFERAWQELSRVTKPGGYVFITSDYFRDHDHWLHSQALGCQHNPFMPERMDAIRALAASAGLRPVGTWDPAWLAYDGDHVNNYSFVTLCFQKA